MNEFFLTLLNMGITAGWLVAAVCLLRILLSRMPKWVRGILWTFVAIRLICPFSIESTFSLLPRAEVLPKELLAPEAMTESARAVIFVAVLIWLEGVAAMFLYALSGYFKIKRQVREAAVLKENIWVCDHIDTPFILGIFRPKIYLPSFLNEQEQSLVLLHEQAHVSRRDHIWKPFGFLLLAVYWFCPFLWIAYALFCKDIEFACDERVIKRSGYKIKIDYSNTLLACSVSRKLISACPLAFGENGVKSRIQNILSYRKPARTMCFTAFVACSLAGFGLLTSPPETVWQAGKMTGKAVSWLKDGSTEGTKDPVRMAEGTAEGTKEPQIVKKEPLKAAAMNYFPGASGEGQKCGNNQGNAINFGYFCEADGFVYYRDKNQPNLLCREPAVGDSSKRTVLAVEEEADAICWISVMGEYVYYTAGGKVKRVPAKGGASELIYKGACNLQVTQEKIYFSGEEGICSINLDGTGKKVIYTQGNREEKDLIWLNVYGEYVLFVVSQDQMSLYAVKQDGSECFLLERNVMHPVVEGDVVYYTHTEDKWGGVDAINLKTGEYYNIPTERTARNKVVCGDKIYYNTFQEIRVYSMTDQKDELVYGVAQPNSGFINTFWVTENRVYIDNYDFVEIGSGEVIKAQAY